MNRIQLCSKPVAAGMALALSMGVAVAQNGGMNSQQQQPQAGANAPGSMNSPGGPNSMPGMTMNSQASMQDKMFLKDAATGDMFEIQSSQLALQKSSSADVKQFAQMMIDDHTKLDNEMKPIAAEAEVTPPTSLTGKPQKEYQKLQGLSGDAFDKEYISDMVMDHAKVSKAFGAEANGGQLPDERKAAMTNKPTVDMHLQKAQQLAQAHNVPVKM